MCVLFKSQIIDPAVPKSRFFYIMVNLCVVLLEFLCQRFVPLGKHIDGVNTFLQILADIFLLKLELGALDSNCFQQNVNILLPFILGA